MFLLLLTPASSLTPHKSDTPVGSSDAEGEGEEALEKD